MKDSGVAWIGEAPSHWTTVRIKDIAKLNPQTLLPKAGEVDFFPMEAIGVDGGLALGQSKSITQAGGYSQMKNGDVCFAKVTPCFENGKSAIVEGLDSKGALATTEIIVLRPNKKIHRDFLHYRIKGLDFASGGANEMKGAGGLKRVPERFASDFVFQLPPFAEQLTIATYLDRQTALIDKRLDTLAEKKSVLAELRKAAIHEVVTKGLNKAAAMKDSGVAWMGEIPANWEIRRFKDAGSFQTGKDHKTLNEGYIPVYGSSRGPFAFVDRALCKWKAIAIGRKGTIDQPFVIQAGFWAVDTCMFNTALKKNFSLEYLGYWAEIIPWREMSTQTALPSLTQTDANNAIVGYPPLPEQRAIADHLDRQTVLIDSQLATLDKQAQILKELRKAIIHEAVTGKIDLSGPSTDVNQTVSEWNVEIPSLEKE